jgi:hypothetical protein
MVSIHHLYNKASVPHQYSKVSIMSKFRMASVQYQLSIEFLLNFIFVALMLSTFIAESTPFPETSRTSNFMA